MGRDKATVAFGAGDLLGHAVERLRAAGASEVALLCGPAARYAEWGLPLVLDVVADAGPVAGLLAALASLPAGGRALVLAVDVPFAPAPLLTALDAACTGGDAAVPESPTGPEPLVACYAQSCLEPLAARVRSGDRRLTSFWPDVSVVRPGPEWLARFGDPARLFANWNAPEDRVAGC